MIVKKKKEVINREWIQRAAEQLGSVIKLSHALGISETAVYKWMRGSGYPSVYNCILIEKVTDGKVKAKDIRPEIDWEKVKDELERLR